MEKDNGISLSAVMSGLIIGVAFVVILALVMNPQPVQNLEMAQDHNTTPEEIAESKRLFDAASNYTILKEANRKFGSGGHFISGRAQIDDSPQTLAKFRNVDDAKAVIQYVITKGLYLGEGDRGVKITIVVDSNYMPAETYVKCLGADIAEEEGTDIGRLSNAIECA